MAIKDFLPLSVMSLPVRAVPRNSPLAIDRCPKDLRGEYGYKAFRARIDRANTARREYIDHKYNNYRRRN